MASVTISLAAGSQGCMFMAALYFIFEAAKEHKEELAALPVDKEVGTRHLCVMCVYV